MAQQYERGDGEIERICTRLIHELARHTDTADYPAALALYTDDAVMERDGERFAGIEALRAAYAARPPNRLTRHVISNTVVRVAAPDAAEAISYVTVYRHRLSEAGLEPPYLLNGADALGEYHDRFTRTGAGWRLASRITRTILQFKNPVETSR